MTSHNQKRSTVSKTEAEKIKTRERILEYQESWARYLDAKTSNRLDATSISATTSILELNPDAYSAWNFRRRVLVAMWNKLPAEDIQAMAQLDLKFIEKLVRGHPKSYWLWLHRRWVLENMPCPDWSRELKLIHLMLDMDPRNFHGWDYRRIILAKAGRSDEKTELDYSMSKINQNFSNYSAWHYRSKLIPRVNWEKEGERESAVQKDFEIVRNAIYTEPADQSAWLYQRWLLGQEQPPLAIQWSYLARNIEGHHIAFVCFNHPVFVDHQKISYGGHNRIQVEDLNLLKHGRNIFAVRIIGLVEDLELEFSQSAFRYFKGTFFKGHTIKVSWNKGEIFGSVSENEGEESLSGSGAVARDQYQPRSIWIREMKSIRELVEVEPESKWPLMSLVHVLRELKGYSQEAIEHLKTLKKVDPDRLNYYSDYISDFQWEGFVESIDATSPELVVKEPYGFTRIPTPHLLPQHIIRVTITNQQLITIPQFPLVEVMILDDNSIIGFEGVEWLFLLKELSVKRNKIQSLDALTKANSALNMVWVEGNTSILDKRVEKDGIRVIYSS